MSDNDEPPLRKGPPKLTLVPVSGEGHDKDIVEPHDGDDGASEPKPVLASAGGAFPACDDASGLRFIEALLFASPDPISVVALAKQLPDRDEANIAELLGVLQAAYEGRGINLVCVGGKWTFRTAQDLAYLLRQHGVETRRLSKAALETLAIIGYHQPVTRAEVEEIRGVTTSAGTLDILLETGWVRLRGRRRAPGRPVTYGTTDGFLSHFGLESIKDLPGLTELKGAGLLDSSLPANFQMPAPDDVASLMPDELPLDDIEGEEDDDDGSGTGGYFDDDPVDEGSESSLEGLSAGDGSEADLPQRGDLDKPDPDAD